MFLAQSSISRTFFAAFYLFIYFIYLFYLFIFFFFLNNCHGK